MVIEGKWKVGTPCSELFLPEKDDVFDAINGSYGTPDRYSGF